MHCHQRSIYTRYQRLGMHNQQGVNNMQSEACTASRGEYIKVRHTQPAGGEYTRERHAQTVGANIYQVLEVRHAQPVRAQPVRGEYTRIRPAEPAGVNIPELSLHSHTRVRHAQPARVNTPELGMYSQQG
jgi:hypothetical protein